MNNANKMGESEHHLQDHDLPREGKETIDIIVNDSAVE